MSKINIQEDHVNLLWTGGWDSTFQLLQLLLIYRSSVKPFYLIHEGRGSIHMEIKTMKKIKNFIIKTYPYTKHLLLPTQYYAVSDILPNARITSAHESILENSHIGDQYDWLARLCEENNISNMQLSVEKPLKINESYWDANFDNMLIEETINSQVVYRVNPKHKNSDIFTLFQNFVFPIRSVTKIQMNEISTDKGWDKIMRMTWFCHNPTNKNTSCGICKPCQQLIKSGFGWRIRGRRKLVSILYGKIIWPLKSSIKIVLNSVGLLPNQITS